jgi:tetratricopeptide (TPR) repeat protein
MKRHLFIACCAVLAATRAFALNPQAQDWLGLRTEERRCADPRRGPDAMLRQCSEALERERDPKARLALLTDLGIAYAQAGRLNPAMDCFAHVLIADPDNWRVLALRGEGYMRMERPKEALADAGHVLRIKPDFAFAHLLRGRALAAQGAFDAALSEIGAAIALEPGSPSGYNVRGNVYAQKGQSALAIADFGKAIAIKPQAPYYNNRCFERAKPDGGDLAGALADCNKALETDTGANVFDSRGFVHFRMGDYQSAAADYYVALDKKPAYASSLFMRGVIKRKAGDAAGGDADIAAAKALDAGIADEYAKYGVVP